MQIVRVLIANGAAVRFEEEYAKPSPLHLAVRKGNLDIINLLLDCGWYILLRIY